MARDLLARRSGQVHLMGVAGVGMAGLAAHLHWMGFEVSGCDLKANDLTAWLRGLGVDVFIGHAPGHIDPDLSALIRSTAVPASHPELLCAMAAGIPVLRRGAVLAGIVNACRSAGVCGSHGKTTTAAMLAQVLRGAGMDAGFFVGAVVDRLGGVAGRGEDFFVAEADESDGTLACYAPEYAILTNADIDHLEHYDGEDSLWECFRGLLARTGRKVVYNCDDQRACAIVGGCDRGLSYGFSSAADVRGAKFAQTASSCSFDLIFAEGRPMRMELPVAGLHNASNALAVCALGLELGLAPQVLRRELACYAPPRRRFEFVSRWGGADIYMDYSHHPTEIKALLQSIRNMDYRRIIAIFQPHRYTRTLALGSEFPAAFRGVDRLIITPVFAASEEPLAGGRSEDLFAKAQAEEEFQTDMAESLQDAWSCAQETLCTGDLLLLIGAGDIETIADWARNTARQF